jgi:RHS repeat-associated protein
VQRPAPAALIAYGIDGLNRRVSKSVGGSIQRAWAYDGARIVAEINGATFLSARFVYGTRPQVPDYMIEIFSGEVHRILTDHLGSVRLVVRVSDGAIVQELAYGPWGEVEKDTNPGFQPFGFAGGMYDPDTRLVRFGARDYDPAIGRWTAKDPSGFAGGTNLYAYADNDPVNRIDLTGENPAFFVLAGAMEGIAGDLLFQMVVQGRRPGCIDGTELAIAGVMGALTGGAANWLQGAAQGGATFGRSTVGAAERFTGKWGKGGFGSAADSLFYHFEKHGASVGAETVEQYLIKAQAFASRLTRAHRFPVEGATEGVVRYVKAGKYIDIAPGKIIISFGSL